MRAILPILFALVAGGCDPIAAGGSFSGDKCAAGDATLDTLTIGNAFRDLDYQVGDPWTPGEGDQGLSMSQFALYLTGSAIPDCVQVHARAENAVLDGPKTVGGQNAARRRIDVFIGPVDDSYAIDASVAGLAAHLEISHNVVSVVR